ncbi:MAG: OmpA family protein [Spirochaetia bacterium]|nr:OmpA family protein [Spirochaetia bacterium]
MGRYVYILIFAIQVASCSQNSDYLEFPYRQFGKEVKTKIGSVYFDKNSYSVTPGGLKDIMAATRMLSLYERYNDTQRIRIIGYADQDGEASLNMQLGLARAEEVGRVLENFGISMSNAKIASYGESRTYVNNNTFRKVEIWLENDPLAFLKSELFSYLFLSVLISFLIGFMAHRVIKSR